MTKCVSVDAVIVTLSPGLNTSKRAGLEFVAGNVDNSVNDVDGALLVACIERHR